MTVLSSQVDRKDAVQFSPVLPGLNFAYYISDLWRLLSLSVTECPHMLNRDNDTVS